MSLCSCGWNSIYRPGWPWTPRDSLASVSQVLGLMVYTITSSSFRFPKSVVFWCKTIKLLGYMVCYCLFNCNWVLPGPGSTHLCSLVVPKWREVTPVTDIPSCLWVRSCREVLDPEFVQHASGAFCCEGAPLSQMPAAAILVCTHVIRRGRPPTFGILEWSILDSYAWKLVYLGLGFTNFPCWILLSVIGSHAASMEHKEWQGWKWWCWCVPCHMTLPCSPV